MYPSPTKGSSWVPLTTIVAALVALGLGLLLAAGARAELKAELVHDINPGPSSGFPGSYAVVGNQMFFSANDGVHGYELWKSDGVNTSLVKDINPGPSDRKSVV